MSAKNSEQKISNTVFGEPENDIEYCLSPTDIIYSKTCPSMVIKDFNNVFLRASGWSADDLIGKRHNILRHSDVPDEIFTDLRKTISAGRVWHGVVKNKRKDGSYYWVDATITPIVENGMIKGYQSIRYPATEAQKIKASRDYKLIKQGKIPAPNTLNTLKPSKQQRFDLYMYLSLLMVVGVSSVLFGLYDLLTSTWSIIFIIAGLYIGNTLRSFKLLDDDTAELQSIKELSRGNFRIKIPKNSVFTESLELIRTRVANNSAADIDCSIKTISNSVLMDTIRGIALFVDVDFKIYQYSLSGLKLEEDFGVPLGDIFMSDYFDKSIYHALTKKYDRQYTVLKIGNNEYDAIISPIVYNGDIKSYLFLLYNK